MVITAKFASVCPCCSQRIHVGSKIEWSKGAPARHTACATMGGTVAPAAKSAPKAAPRAPKTPGVADAPYERMFKGAPCKRAFLPDATSEVLVANGARWAHLRSGAQGTAAADGEAFFVVGQTAYYQSAEDADDMGNCDGAGWVVTLYLRRATAEEAAPALARVAERKAAKAASAERKALITELGHLCEAGMRGSDDAARKPAGREIELAAGVHGSGRKVAILSEDGGGVAIWCSGYYDDYRATLSVTRDPQAVAIMGLLGVVS